MTKKTQPWLFSPVFDLVFILGPALIVTLIVLIFQGQLDTLKTIPPWLWLVLVAGVDVSHVYSTLFRTYLDREELKQRQALYTLVPLGAWMLGWLLYSVNGSLFWRALAYLAVFHFVRQQYGFMMIYSRQEWDQPALYKYLDKIAIYSATLYPLVYWHCHERSFNWFVAGDFVTFDAPLFSRFAGGVYLVVLLAYGFKEIILWRRIGRINWPRNLLLLGTAVSWFVGIVAFDNDLAFTATNIIAHGIPYMALIWVYGHNQQAINGAERKPFVYQWVGKLFSWRTVPVYTGGLFLLAYLEEWAWNGLIWRDHVMLFKFSEVLPVIQSEQTLVWLVPLLALPQATHYILDAFIWRLKLNPANLKNVLFYNVVRKV